MRLIEPLHRSTGSRVRSRFRLRRRSPLPVDYRDRISVAGWLLVFGMGTSLLVNLPTMIFSFSVLGSPMGISFNTTTLAALFLGVLAAAATEGIVALHPRLAAPYRSWMQTWPYWALPMALTIMSILLLPLVSNRLVQVIALLLSGALLALTFHCLYATVERGQPGFRRSRLILDALAYAAALLLFLLVYQTRTRSLLSGSLIAVTAILLAVELLRSTSDSVGIVLSYGAIVGLILGQVTWALNYWLLPDLTGGLILLLIFYLLTGIAQQGLQRRLNRRVLLEFALFAAVAILLIAVVAPQFG